MIRRAALCALLAVGCTQKQEPVAPAAAAPRPTPVVQASAIPAVAPAGDADLLASEYRQADDILRKWEGDKAQLEDARSRLMAIVAKDKGYALAYVGLANVEIRTKPDNEDESPTVHQERAYKFSQHALKLNPELYEAHLAAGWIARHERDTDKAREAAEAAEKIRPNTAGVRLLRADIGLTGDDPRETVKHAKDALEVATDPYDKAAAYRYLVEAYEFGSHLEEADHAYQEMLKATPDSSSAHARYSALLLYRDDVDGAVQHAEKAMSLFKSPLAEAVYAQAYLKKAQMLWDANQVAESTKYVEKIAELPGSNARVSFALGKFYENAAVRGKDKAMRKKALVSYKKAVELDANYEDAKRAVERLEKTVSAFGG